MRDLVHTIVLPIAPTRVIKTRWGNSPEQKQRRMSASSPDPSLIGKVDLSMWTGSLFPQNAVVNAWHSYDRQHNIQLENPNLCCTCITVLPVTTVSRSDNSLLWDEGPGAHQRPIAPTSDQDQVRKFTWKSAAAKILWNYKLWENTLKKLSKIFWEILNQVQHLFPHRFCPLAEKKEDPRQLAQQSQQKWEENTCFRSSWDVSYPL